MSWIHCSTTSCVPPRNVIYSQVNLWFCALHWKLFFRFCMMKLKGFSGKTHSHHPSICNLFEETRCFKYGAWENLVMISNCLKHDYILVRTFQRYAMKFFESKFKSLPEI
jgi:hypothetical protein